MVMNGRKRDRPRRIVAPGAIHHSSLRVEPQAWGVGLAGTLLMYIQTALISSSVIWPARAQGMKGLMAVPFGRRPVRSARTKSSLLHCPTSPAAVRLAGGGVPGGPIGGAPARSGPWQPRHPPIVARYWPYSTVT